MNFRAEMPPELFSIPNFDFDYLERFILFKIAQKFFKERLCQVRKEIISGARDISESLEQGLVQLLHTGGLR